MTDTKRSRAGEAVTDLVLEVFRFNSYVIAAGDDLVADLGLTSARWQVLGAIALAGRPQPVAWLARDMGNSRQSVQRIVNELEKDGLLAFSPNPHHRRAQLIVLTERGKRVFGATMQLQIPWVNNLADRVLVKDIDVARRVIATLRERLQRDMDVEPDAIRS